MSISAFKEELLKRLDKVFEEQANAAFGAIRMFDDKRATFITGKSDGIHIAAQAVRDTYELFVNSEEEKEEDAKPLY